MRLRRPSSSFGIALENYVEFEESETQIFRLLGMYRAWRGELVIPEYGLHTSILVSNVHTRKDCPSWFTVPYCPFLGSELIPV